MLQEELVALSTRLLAAEKGDDHGALGPLACGQRPRQLQHGNAAGSIVVRAVVNALAVALAQMVHVRGEKNDLVFQFGIASRNYANDVARGPLLLADAIKVEVAGDVLNVTAVVARRSDAHGAQLFGQELRGVELVRGTAATALHFVAR